MEAYPFGTLTDRPASLLAWLLDEQPGLSQPRIRDCSRSVHESRGLEEPLAAEKERPRHPRMRHAQADAPFAAIDVVLLIEQIDHIEPEQELLSVPRQWNDMGD